MLLINAIIALEFEDFRKDALRKDEFVSELLKSELPNRWHVEGNVLWFGLSRLYIPQSLQVKIKTLSYENPLADH